MKGNSALYIILAIAGVFVLYFLYQSMQPKPVVNNTVASNTNNTAAQNLTAAQINNQTAQLNASPLGILSNLAGSVDLSGLFGSGGSSGTDYTGGTTSTDGSGSTSYVPGDLSGI